MSAPKAKEIDSITEKVKPLIKELVEEINARDPIKDAGGNPVKTEWVLDKTVHVYLDPKVLALHLMLEASTHWATPVEIIGDVYSTGPEISIRYGSGGVNADAGDEAFLVKGRGLIEAVELKQRITKILNQHNFTLGEEE